jgi:hypothetical protein
MSKPKVCESAFWLFAGFVFRLFFCMGLDFYDFLRCGALSHRAVWGLYRSMSYLYV